MGQKQEEAVAGDNGMGVDALIDRFKSDLGPGGVLEGAELAERAHGWSRLGTPLALLRPISTEQVSTILRACHEARQPIVPWGGKTGLVEGANADGVLAISLDRMNHVLEVDKLGATLTVEAGCILQSAHEAADQAGYLFPLDLGSRGSCTVGGNISTNAGGNRVIRYGMMRDLVLGLEAVLADGTIVSSLNHLIKNNTGYDLKHLFIGAEGTLGVVTKAVLRLRPKPASQNTALVAVDEFANLPALLRRVEAGFGGTLSAFEVMWDAFYELVTTAPAKGTAPIPHGHPQYVLIDALGSEQENDEARFERVLEAAFEAGEISDAVIAKSQAERNAIWSLRDDVAQFARLGPTFNFDVSLAIPHMESLIAEVKEKVFARWPEGRLMVFGHMGDGNLHFCAGVGDGSHETHAAVEDIIYGGVRARGGAVSAEHGIGLEKKPYLPWSRSPAELALMATIKRALDPHNILNPGKIFSLEGAA